MSEIDNKILALKEELLNEIREAENRTKSSNKDLENEVNNQLNQFVDGFNENKQKIVDLQNFNATVKVKVLDHVNELLTFKTNTSEDLFTQSIQINNMQKDFSSTTEKLDKMYLENLILPGKIGEHCQYQNLREYLEVNNLN